MFWFLFLIGAACVVVSIVRRRNEWQLTMVGGVFFLAATIVSLQ